MPAFGNVVLNDGATTPVAHTFSPVKTDGDLATYADRSTGTPSKYLVLGASNRDPVGGNGQVNRVEYSFSLPVVADGTDPAVKAGTVLRTARFNGVALIPVTSTLQERKDLLAYIKNLYASTLASSMMQDLEHVY